MTLTATTADMTVTATVEMAVPTNLGDLMVTTAPIEARLTAIAAEIRVEMKRTVESVIKIGKLLLTAKELTADPKCGVEGTGSDQRFARWRSENFADRMDQRTAFNAMQVARTYGDRDPADLENIGLSILYELAAPSTPADTRAMIEANIQNGDNLTVKDVKGIIRDARNPSPSISAPAPSKDEEEDDLPFDPSPGGKPTFVPSGPTSTSTPSPSPGNTPDVEGNDEEEEDVQRKRGRLYAADLITDPEQKMKHDLTLMLGQIAGGNNFDGTTVKLFIPSYMKELNAAAVYNTMRGDMMQSLSHGASLDDARTRAKEEMEVFRAEMLRLVNEACDAGEQMFAQRTAPMDKVVKFLPKAFHLTTPLNEAVTAARKCLQWMGFGSDAA